jgi:hypothetical protein
MMMTVKKKTKTIQGRMTATMSETKDHFLYLRLRLKHPYSPVHTILL